MRNTFSIILLLFVIAGSFGNSSGSQYDEQTIKDECDSISVLGSVINNIFHGSYAIVYSKDIIALPIEYILYADKIIDNSKNIKYFDRDTELSALNLKEGDILFKQIRYEKNYSELNISVWCIGGNGSESVIIDFTYSVDLDKCSWWLEDSKYTIID
ncbi:MAG: hypothetical protein KDC42_10215 [Ignavibacteriae bacterium]|nr:hypothetical protein [Ignavibacteriota bacterium]